ncbi:SRPBCC family protein [Streptomyces millisiae]|uniref:SRPBCC family protein n=1 Tax=Streptomyces millisiae TaxID=3075542 RepID=A0ABU2LRX9_9ACTN|nr:SRPBCC family protein [Streptomyces sp. DSM 44918]MDT0320349.1 SRPBCC family protein [Streptomyces sp. DSM 44918]
MSEIADRINAVHRELGKKRIPAGEGTTVLLRRGYAAPIEDVWDACTDPERLARWFLPVTGDLRLGGSYQLKGNARGEILHCEPPRLLRVTWVFGENTTDKDISEVELRLAPGEDGETILELEHAAVVPAEFWKKFGPGATGVGWDGGLLGLDHHLRGEDLDPATWHDRPEAREFNTLSAQAWGAAHAASGADPAEVAAATAATTEFYAPAGDAPQ